MGFNTYLLKIGDYTFPTEYITFNTFKPIRGVQDLDSYRDANGVLHRNALSHEIYKVEFQSRSMTNKEYDIIMDNIRSRYTNAQERKAQVDMFIPETGQYTGLINAYIPDPEITIQKIIDDTTLKYEPVTFKFIGY